MVRSNVHSEALLLMMIVTVEYRQGSDPEKQCMAFGYQKRLKNCDFYKELPYKYYSAGSSDDKGEKTAGQFRTTCGEYNWVREQDVTGQ